MAQFLGSDITAALWVSFSAVVALVAGAALQALFTGKSLRFTATFFIVLCAVLLAFLGFAFARREQIAQNVGRIEHMLFAGSGDLVVVAVYPSDVYGPSQLDGLHAGLAPYARNLRIVDIVAPYAELKANNAPQVLQRLRQVLVRHNVVAVVGPGVTEFTRSMVQEVRRSGLGTPVFITGSAPRDVVGWSDAGVPLFRINSGIDERAHDFVELARTAIAAQVPLVFLVETNPNSDERTYGQVLFDHVIRDIPEWSQWVERSVVDVRPYEKGQLAAQVGRWDPDVFLGRRQLVMVLGAGSDYASFADNYYRTTHRFRRSLVGGWMNAYSTDSIYRRGAYQWNRMFEVTDISMSAPETAALNRFRTTFGPVTPALRDQAVLFDTGLTIALATNEAKRNRNGEIHVHEGFSRRFAQILSRQSFVGVTGNVRFNYLGQNIGLTTARGLEYVWYTGSRGWRRLDGPRSVVVMLDH